LKAVVQVDGDVERVQTVHILTKIFIVLVSLLTAALVPLVVVYTKNEDNFKSRWESEQAKSAAAQGLLAGERQSRTTAESAMLLAKQSLESRVAELQKESDQLHATLAQKDSELAIARAREGSFGADLKVLANTNLANATLTNSLVNETRELRTQWVNTEKRLVELDERLRDALSQLEVADAARRALQEELQRMKDANAVAMKKIDVYLTNYGDLDQQEMTKGPVDREFEAIITSVERSKDKVLAEVNVGSRDGVKEGWELIIDNGGTFIGRLKIVDVDVNVSTGIVLLEDAKTRGEVAVGQRVIAKKGF
jgi:hypothetical protein